MSTPFGHSLAGYVISSAGEKTLKVKNVRTLLLCIIAANAADLDFLPGMLVGNPNLYHHGLSHSLGMAMIVSLVLATTLKYREDERFMSSFFVYFGCYSTHVILDFLSPDGRPPYGVPIFWPLNDKYFISEWALLPPVSHAGENATLSQFFGEVFSFHNLYAFFMEFVIILPFILLIHLANLLRKKGRDLASDK